MKTDGEVEHISLKLWSSALELVEGAQAELAL